MEHDTQMYRMQGKSALFLLFLAVIFHVAECNYEALFDYDREKYVDALETLIVEDEIKHVTLEQPVLYYGNRYTELQISKDGTVSFGRDPVTFKREPQWHRGFTELASASDKPFIAAFHYDGYASAQPQLYHGRLYWSQYKRHQESEILTSEIREKQTFLNDLGKYLSHSSVTIETFQPDFYVMVTWENVTDYDTETNKNLSCTYATTSQPCPSDTFQLVIVADQKNTFAIFNYAKMDIPYNTAHLAGMNGGSGRGWTDVVKCVGACAKNKLQKKIPGQLPTFQGSSRYQDASGQGEGVSAEAILGRFIFVVSGDIIVRGGCLPRESKARYMDTVEVHPQQVDMLGGNIIKVSGQCQEPYTPIYCRFDRQEVSEGKISAGMVGWCPVPHLSKRGQVKVEVSSDAISWEVYSYVISMSPELEGRLNNEPLLQPWFEVDPSELTVSWNRSQLSVDDGATVDIVLEQYTHSPDKVIVKSLVTLAEKVANTGSFRFDPRSDNRYTCDDHCEDIELGLVKILLTTDHLETATEKQYIAIGPLPLAWYVNRRNKEMEGGEWYKDRCLLWAQREKGDQAWFEEVPACPCTLQQALADWGSWQADVDCNLFDKNRKCPFTNGARHCVRSVQPTRLGSGSHCCYDVDSKLMYAADSYEGSVSSRAHPWGSSANRGNKVPGVSYWLEDMIPYYYCCHWTNREYCHYYTEVRPTKDCRYYDPPGSAIMFGDPHVITFDDESYHFGGAGDFWLVQTPEVSVQARFLERQSDTVQRLQNTLMPTYISSVAVRGDAQSSTVTFSRAPPGDLHPRRLSVMVDYRHHFFDEIRLMWQDFSGLTVVNNAMYATTDEDRSHGNFSVLFANGAGVQVAERNGLLHAVVTLPPFEKDEDNTARSPASKGLLGSWDGKKANEYMKPDDIYVPLTESSSIKYRDFALKCLSLSQSEVSTECGTGEKDMENACAYVYYVTGNRTLARDTRLAQEAFQSLRTSQTKVWSCGWLDIPFALKDYNDYTAGHSIRVTGCREGPGSTGSVYGGPTEFRCVQNETERQPFWNPYEINSKLCTEEAASASMVMIIGIVAAVVVVVAVAVIGFVCYKRRKSNSESFREPKATARAEATMDPGTDETLLKRGVRDRDAQPMRERKSEPV